MPPEPIQTRRVNVERINPALPAGRHSRQGPILLTGWGRGITFALTALDNAMRRVARAANGKREITLNGESYAIGRLVGWVELSRAARGLEVAILSNTVCVNELTFAQEYGREHIRLKILRALVAGMARPYPRLKEVTTG